MKENERFNELIDKIHSFPEPNYESDFSKEKQKQINDRLMKIAKEHDNKRRKQATRKRFFVGFAGLAAILIATIMYLSTDEMNRNTSNTDKETKVETEESLLDEEKTEQTTEEEVELIEYDSERYEEIVEIYENYDLVTEDSEVDYIDEKYGVIYYKNGFSIIKESKSVAHWPQDWLTDPNTLTAPKSYQVLAAIKANIEAMKNGGAITKGDGTTKTPADFEVDYTADIAQKLQVLYRIKEYADPSYEPLIDWINSTISYFEKAQGSWEKNPEKTKILYDQGMNNVLKFMEALGSGFA